MDRLAFIQQLEIDCAPSQLPILARSVKLYADQNQGFVDSGSLVSFVSGIGKQNREDVLNSTLLAQLAANKKFNRQEQIEEWYQFYVDVLSKLGWVIQNFSFEKYRASGQTMEISSAILEVIGAILSESELEALKVVIGSLKQSSNAPWWEVFSNSSTSSEKGNMQIMPAKEDSSGQVVLALGSFHFTGKSETDQWLWFKYSSSDISLYKGTQAATLNSQLYSKVRQAVIDKLGDNIKKSIGELEI